eukprot:GHVS01023586.1.p1 GENE.GHVS01023586.1~~GHVS01023586.1.p1  ORF type:complete len:421 (+),score=85.55 GHVS01023586.1:79-1341(+)
MDESTKTTTSSSLLTLPTSSQQPSISSSSSHGSSCLSQTTTTTDIAFESYGRHEEVQETIERTKAALENCMIAKIAVGQLQRGEKPEPKFYKYTPDQQAPGHNANCSQRVIRMVDKITDPLEPSKFRHKRVPRGPPSPPPPVQHSPPRKLTMKDQAEWKIPPCVSNWKNQKGYTIPLDKRLQADGRGLQDVTVNDRFAALSESLYIAERSAREEIRIRNEMMKQKKLKEEQIREIHLRELAAKARAERSTLLAAAKQSVGEDDGSQQREVIEKDRKRELERDMRLEKAGKKNKRNRDDDRDISERIALGQAQPTSQESLFDARLFNQSAGMDSGFHAGNDEKYAAYDKPLFADRSAAGIYRFEKDRMQQNAGDMSAVPSFSGADKAAPPRTKPVEFEKEVADPFGLDKLLSEAKDKDSAN